MNMIVVKTLFRERKSNQITSECSPSKAYVGYWLVSQSLWKTWKCITKDTELMWHYGKESQRNQDKMHLGEKYRNCMRLANMSSKLENRIKCTE